MALPDPIAYWPLNEAAGTTAADASGNGHTATLSHGTWHTGNLRAFGAAGLANTDGGPGATFTPINLGTVHTVAWWMNGWNGTNDGVVIGGVTDVFAAYLDGSTTIYYTTGPTNTVTKAHGGLTGAHHVAVVRNGTTVTWYKDGVSLGSSTLPTNTALTVNVISGYGAGAVPFVGTLDEVRFYNVALTGPQVAELVALNPDPAGTLARVAATPATIQTANATTIAVTFATPPALGAGILVGVFANLATASTGCTDLHGNTYTLAKAQATSNNNGALAIYLCEAVVSTGSPFTITVAGAAATRSAIAVGYNGPLALDQTVSGSGSSNTASAGPTAALTGAESVQLAVVGTASALSTIFTVAAAPPPWIEELADLVTPPSGEVDSRVVVSALGRTPSVSWALNGAHAWGAAIVACKAGTPPLLTVPDVVGLSEAAADTALIAAGFVTGTITTATSPTVPAGTVISQSPAAGASAALGSAVALVVSTGPPPPAGWRVEIEGVDQTPLVDRFDVSATLNDRARASLVVGDLLPERFDEVLAYAADGTTPLFGGVIIQRQFTGRTPYDPTWQTTLECGDWMTFADWCFTNLTYPSSVLLKDVLTDLVETHLAQYDITLADDQVDGPSVAPFTWTNTRVSDALRELSDRTGYVVRFTPDKELEMFLPGSREAVFDLTEADPHCQEVSWRDSDQIPYNKVTLTAGPTGSAVVSYEQHDGDGTTRMWVLDAPYLGVIGALHIFSEGAGGYPVGVYGVDDMPYTIDIANNAIRQRVDQTVIAADDFWWMSYLAQFPIVVTATTGATPVIERIETRPEILSRPVAQEIADALLAQAQGAAREATIATADDNDVAWVPGEALTIDLPVTRQLEGEFLITAVALSIVLDTDQGDRHWQWTLEAREGELYEGSYLDGWRRMISEGAAVTVGEGGTVGSPIYLGGSRGVSVSASPAAYQPVVNFMTYEAASSFSGRVRVDLWASNVSIGATARLWNLTDSVSVGESAEITSTTAVSTAFVVAITAGKIYRLEVTADTAAEGVFCVGTLEFT